MEKELDKGFLEMVKSRMDSIGLSYSTEQAEQMADYIHGIALIAQQIQKDAIINMVKNSK